MVENDVWDQVGCGLNSSVLLDLTLPDSGVGLDVRHNNSTRILITYWPRILMAHNNVDVVDCLVWVHGSLEQQVHILMLDLLKLPLGWC